MITESFDCLTPPVMKLEDFYGEKKQLLRICMPIFSREIYDLILRSHPCEIIAEIGAANGHTPVYRFSREGKEIAFYLSPIGSAMAAQFCIEANWLTGADHFILFGSAGSLDREATAGKFIVPTEAYRDEGMSYHYAPAADYIPIRNHGRVSALFRSLGVPFVEGRVWTTDAFLRETVGQMKKRRQEGCIAVEMELAGVQAVCDFYGFELYDFLAAGDVLSEDSYEVEGLHDANHNPDKLQLALALAESL